MGGFNALVIPRATSGGSGNAFPVLRGKGALYGDASGAVARSNLAGGMVRINEPNGIGADPVWYTLNAPCEIARVRVDLAGAQVEIPFEGELIDVEVSAVVLCNFSAVPDPAVQFGLYAYKKENGAVYPGAMIMPENTPINPTGDIAAATLEMDMFKFIPKPRLRRLGELWLIPKVPSTTPLFADLVVRCEPNWMKTWAG